MAKSGISIFSNFTPLTPQIQQSLTLKLLEEGYPLKDASAKAESKAPKAPKIQTKAESIRRRIQTGNGASEPTIEGDNTEVLLGQILRELRQLNETMRRLGR